MNQFTGVLLEENERMSLWLLRLQLSDHLTRVACSQRVGGDVLVYHTSGTDHAVVSDGYTEQQLSHLHTRWRKLVVSETRLFACCPLCNQLRIIVLHHTTVPSGTFLFRSIPCQFHVSFTSFLKSNNFTQSNFKQLLKLSEIRSKYSKMIAEIVKWVLQYQLIAAVPTDCWK